MFHYFNFILFCRSFHATRLVEHERVGNWKSLQSFGQIDRSGQLPSERQCERTVRQQRDHKSIFLTCEQKKIRSHHETRHYEYNSNRQGWKTIGVRHRYSFTARFIFFRLFFRRPFWDIEFSRLYTLFYSAVLEILSDENQYY